jgi:glycosyltransferase involved in cell wall biosynthesis
MHIVECLTHSKLGGAQSVVFSLVRQLNASRPSLRFTMVMPQGGTFVARFKELGVNVVEFPFNRISPFAIVGATKLFQSLQPDVIHSHGKGAGMYARLFMRGVQSVRRIHSFHGFHLPGAPFAASFYRWSEHAMLRGTDAFIAVSTGEAEELRGTFPLNLPPVHVIPNVTDCTSMHASADERLPDAFQKFLAINENRFLVLMIARNDAIKNYQLALGAAMKTLQNDLNVCFVFIGITEHEARRISRVPENIFCIAQVENPSPFLRRADAVMLTSKKESSPLVVQEAFCFGKPVIGTDVEGIRESIVHRVNGLLCLQDSEAIADSIMVLSSNQSLYEQLSDGARATASRASIEEWAEHYYQLYAQTSFQGGA